MGLDLVLVHTFSQAQVVVSQALPVLLKWIAGCFYGVHSYIFNISIFLIYLGDLEFGAGWGRKCILVSGSRSDCDYSNLLFSLWLSFKEGITVLMLCTGCGFLWQLRCLRPSSSSVTIQSYASGMSLLL